MTITNKSAFEIWKSFNPDGTEDEFLDYIQGDSVYQTYISQSGNENKTVEDFFSFLTSGITEFNNLKAEDTNGILGTVNVSVNAQTLANTLSNKIISLEDIASEMAEF